MDPLLDEIWSRCLYGVSTPDGVVDLRVGERSGALDSALPPDVETWALLTAHNPGAVVATNDENRHAEARLDAEIERLGLRAWASSGGRDPAALHAWPTERSRLVLGVSLTQAHELARGHGQVAFLFGCRGGPTSLVEVGPPAVGAGRSLETVAWVQLDDEGRTLMVRPRGQTLWFMPGGKKEAGEHDVAALARELEEELAVRVRRESVRALFVVEALAWGRPDTLVRMACYAALVDGPPHPSGEVEDMRWLGAKDRALVPPAGALVLARVAAGHSPPIAVGRDAPDSSGPPAEGEPAGSRSVGSLEDASAWLPKAPWK